MPTEVIAEGEVLVGINLADFQEGMRRLREEAAQTVADISADHATVKIDADASQFESETDAVDAQVAAMNRREVTIPVHLDLANVDRKLAALNAALRTPQALHIDTTGLQAAKRQLDALRAQAAVPIEQTVRINVEGSPGAAAGAAAGDGAATAAGGGAGAAAGGLALAPLLWGRSAGGTGPWPLRLLLGGGMLAGMGSLGSFAGFGPEHFLMTALGLGGSFIGAGLGAGVVGAGALGAMGVGGGSDLAILKSTIADTKSLGEARKNLAEATALYGRNSEQAMTAAKKLAFLQKELAAGTSGAGVKAEERLAHRAQALNKQFDAETQMDRALAAHILSRGVEVGKHFTPMIAKAAEQNLPLVSRGLAPLQHFLEGPEGNRAFDTLEKVFKHNLPTAMHAFDMAVQVVVKTISFASQYTGGFVKMVDRVFTKLNSPEGFHHFSTELEHLVSDFKTWLAFFKTLGRDIWDLFSQDAHTGQSIVKYLTQMLAKVGEWERSTQGKKEIHNLFVVHKEEILALLSLLPPLVSSFKSIYMTVAPPLVEAVTSVLQVVAKLLKTFTEAGPLERWALGLTLIAAKLKLLVPLLRTVGVLSAADAAAGSGSTMVMRSNTGAEVGTLETQAAADTSLLGRFKGGVKGRIGSFFGGEAGLTGLGDLLPAVAAIGGVANIASSAMQNKWKDAGIKMGGALVGGIAGFMVGGPAGAMLGAGAGTLLGNVVDSLTGASKRLHPVQESLRKIAGETARAWDTQAGAARRLRSAEEEVRGLQERQASASKKVKEAESKLANDRATYGDKSRQVKRDEENLEGARVNLKDVTLKLKVAEEDKGLAADHNRLSLRAGIELSREHGAVLKVEIARLAENYKLEKEQGAPMKQQMEALNILNKRIVERSKALNESALGMKQLEKLYPAEAKNLKSQGLLQDETGRKLKGLKSDIQKYGITGKDEAQQLEKAYRIASQGTIRDSKKLREQADREIVKMVGTTAKAIKILTRGHGGGKSAGSLLNLGGEENIIEELIPELAAGGQITRPMIIAGEEAPQHPEWMIATNPAYRDKNIGHWLAAGHDLGIPGFAQGGDLGKEPQLTGFGGGALQSIGQLGIHDVYQAAKHYLAKHRPSVSAMSLNVPTGPIETMAREMVNAVWGPKEFTPFADVVMRESGWNPHAQNPSSTAYGIAQNLNPSTYPAAGRPGSNAPLLQQAKAQLAWMVNYIRGRYHTPANAWAHEQSAGWYYAGGKVKYMKHKPNSAASANKSAEDVMNWAYHFLGHGPKPGYPEEWCGAFVTEDMEKHGFHVGFNGDWATNWMQFGKPGKDEFGNIVVIGGSGHVGFATGNGKMISGNFNNKVMESTIAEAAGGRPVLGFRKPAYAFSGKESGSGHGFGGGPSRGQQEHAAVRASERHRPRGTTSAGGGTYGPGATPHEIAAMKLTGLTRTPLPSWARGLGKTFKEELEGRGETTEGRRTTLATAEGQANYTLGHVESELEHLEARAHKAHEFNTRQIKAARERKKAAQAMKVAAAIAALGFEQGIIKFATKKIKEINKKLASNKLNKAERKHWLEKKAQYESIRATARGEALSKHELLQEAEYFGEVETAELQEEQEEEKSWISEQHEKQVSEEEEAKAKEQEKREVLSEDIASLNSERWNLLAGNASNLLNLEGGGQLGPGQFAPMSGSYTQELGKLFGRHGALMEAVFQRLRGEGLHQLNPIGNEALNGPASGQTVNQYLTIHTPEVNPHIVAQTLAFRAKVA